MVTDVYREKGEWVSKDKLTIGYVDFLSAAFAVF